MFWVHNTGPAGCLPFTVFYDDSKPRKLDKYGCIKGENEVAKEFNKQLKSMVSKLRKKLVHSAFTYVDVYSAKYSLISNAKKSGKLATRKQYIPTKFLGKKISNFIVKTVDRLSKHSMRPTGHQNDFSAPNASTRNFSKFVAFLY